MSDETKQTCSGCGMSGDTKREMSDEEIAGVLEQTFLLHEGGRRDSIRAVLTKARKLLVPAAEGETVNALNAEVARQRRQLDEKDAEIVRLNAKVAAHSDEVARLNSKLNSTTSFVVEMVAQTQREKIRHAALPTDEEIAKVLLGLYHEKGGK